MAGSSPIVAGTRFVLKHQFSGFPKKEDFDFVEDPMPALKDGEILMDALNKFSFFSYISTMASSHISAVSG